MRLGLLALALGTNVLAQGRLDWTPLIADGTHIRVESAGMSRLDGTYLGVRGDSLRLALGRGGVTVAAPLDRVITIDVSQGRDRARWAGLGMLGGALGGGVLFTVMFYQDTKGTLGTPVILVVGALVGTVLGGVSGAIWAPESWTRYRNPDR